MSEFDGLISELQSVTVPFVQLSDIAEIVRGERITKKDLAEDGKYVVISGGTSPMGRYNHSNRTANTITISSYGAAGYIDFITEDFWANDICLCVIPDTSIVDNKYLYYALKTQQEYIYGNTTKAIPDHIPTQFLKALAIPLPDLDVQHGIVQILDTFIAITTNLEKELAARMKQFNHYRESIITQLIVEGVSEIDLGKIATDIFRGAGIKRDQVVDVGVPCVRYGQIYTDYNIWFDHCNSSSLPEYVPSPKYFEHGDILFAITGESVDEIAKSIAYTGHEKCMAGGDIVVMKHAQNAKYLAYALSTNYAQKQKSKGKVKSKVVHSSVPAIKEIKIPIPTLEKQAQIAEQLDALLMISGNIEKELYLRKKQYEFYRDRLLTFKEA